MIENLPAYTPGSPADPASERILIWASHGIAEGWIKNRLLPVCRHFEHRLNRGDAPESIQALEGGEGDWDILFLGGSPNKISGAAALETTISRISFCRPLECLVAVTAFASQERQLALLRAGAADVLTLDAEDELIRQTLGRLIGLVQARRQQSEQDKLRLISQLAISVNHEINNPLTGLMGTAELLLLEDRGLSDKIRHDLRTIIKQCHRIQEVTARLKTLNHLRTVPYGSHDQMIDLIGELHQEPAATSLPGEQFLPAPRILVVDDNPLIIDLIARLFEQRFTIDAASCASDALNMIERTAYDLVLIDLILPEMNGLELFRALRRMKPRQKALLMTAYEGDARVEQAIAEGAAGCIFKPFQLEDLETALSEAIKQK